ncbi:MAG: IS1595 family transposase [Paludisphaera borealis]|uniref:IS1595 family transposase n=1 Tax=Paludisphaera borealis TaxID=1387353 RepID=UPI00283F510A|nr:IS1595 family transposase [Paludisphaera borealis]MDR3620511.1 IS1595 family transposase [Paludisphaera borealis]
MTQHFLLSSAARTLSLKAVMRMSEGQAREAFQRIRWHEREGEPFCSRCGCAELYDCKAEKLWKCKGCGYRFSVTSGTIFASRKMDIRDILAAIALFSNGAKGISALQMSRDLNCQYKTAYVLCHKIRESLTAKKADSTVSGEVEVDGAYFGGYIKPANHKADRKDRRLAIHQNGKRRVVVIMRERNGKTLPFVFKTEDEAIGTIQSRVVAGSTIHADEASGWDALHAKYLTKRVNHSKAYSHDGACTNQAESFFSRIRRAEVGTHHHIAGPYLAAYAGEMAWREDNRRVSNGEQYLLATHAALTHGVSRQWKGYWQRAA